MAFICLMMNYLCDVIFKTAATKIGEITFFAYNSASRVDKNEILVSAPMFLRVRNLSIARRNS